MVPEPHDLKPGFFQSRITYAITGFPRCAGMLASIQFNNHLHPKAYEIHHVATQWHLSTELETGSPRAQGAPEALLGLRSPLSKRPGGGSKRWFMWGHGSRSFVCPLTLPLSHVGERERRPSAVAGPNEANDAWSHGVWKEAVRGDGTKFLKQIGPWPFLPFFPERGDSLYEGMM